MGQGRRSCTCAIAAASPQQADHPPRQIHPLFGAISGPRPQSPVRQGTGANAEPVRHTAHEARVSIVTGPRTAEQLQEASSARCHRASAELAYTWGLVWEASRPGLPPAADRVPDCDRPRILIGAYAMLYRGMDRRSLMPPTTTPQPSPSAMRLSRIGRHAARRCGANTPVVSILPTVIPRASGSIRLSPPIRRRPADTIHGGYWQMNDKGFRLLRRGPASAWDQSRGHRIHAGAGGPARPHRF